MVTKGCRGFQRPWVIVAEGFFRAFFFLYLAPLGLALLPINPADPFDWAFLNLIGWVCRIAGFANLGLTIVYLLICYASRIARHPNDPLAWPTAKKMELGKMASNPKVPIEVLFFFGCLYGAITYGWIYIAFYSEWIRNNIGEPDWFIQAIICIFAFGWGLLSLMMFVGVIFRMLPPRSRPKPVTSPSPHPA